MILKSIHGQDLKGTWFMIKDGYTYCNPMFVEFNEDQIFHFEVKKGTNGGFLEKKLVYHEKLSETKNELISLNRIRLYRMGKIHTVLSETESKTEYTEFATDYEKITPTITTLEDEQIEKLEFKISWKDENFTFAFNQILDSQTIREGNKRLGKEGRKIILEKLSDTYFGSIYDNGERETLIPIREISPQKIVLYGFPEEPYEVVSLEKIK